MVPETRSDLLGMIWTEEDGPSNPCRITHAVILEIFGTVAAFDEWRQSLEMNSRPVYELWFEPSREVAIRKLETSVEYWEARAREAEERLNQDRAKLAALQEA